MQFRRFSRIRGFRLLKVVSLVLVANFTHSTYAFEGGVLYDSSNSQHSSYIENVLEFRHREQGICTAVLLSEDSVLTVRHCLRAQSQIKKFGIEFREAKRLDVSTNTILYRGESIALSDARVFSEDDHRELVLAKLSKKLIMSKAFRFAGQDEILKRYDYEKTQFEFISAGLGARAKNEQRGQLNFSAVKMGSPVYLTNSIVAPQRFLLMQPNYQEQTPLGPLGGDSGSALFDPSNGVLWGIAFSALHPFSGTLRDSRGNRQNITIPMIPYIMLPDYYFWIADKMKEMQIQIPQDLQHAIDERS